MYQSQLEESPASFLNSVADERGDRFSEKTWEKTYTYCIEMNLIDLHHVSSKFQSTWAI